MADKQIVCSYCARKRCFMGDLSQAPEFCPSVVRPELIEEAKARLKDSENQKQLPMTAMPAVEAQRIAGQQPTHYGRYRRQTGF
ncbi:MAG: hypothetical protein KAV87_49020 [Desulfobacteraceae bacterium]|nr:hypothetical protein [Desulfobacteraceae bacterium]